MKHKFKLHDQYIEYEPGSPISVTLKGDDRPVDIVLTEEQLEKLVKKIQQGKAEKKKEQFQEKLEQSAKETY